MNREMSSPASTKIGRAVSAGMPRSTLFPYTTLFRSQRDHRPGRDGLGVDERHGVQIGLILDEPGDVQPGVDEDRKSGFSRNAEIYTLSLHDALPISARSSPRPRWPWSRRTPRCANRFDS